MTTKIPQPTLAYLITTNLAKAARAGLSMIQMGITTLGRSFVGSNAITSLALLVAIIYVCHSLSQNATLLLWLHDFAPTTFTLSRITQFYELPFSIQNAVFVILSLSMLIGILGPYVYWSRWREGKQFRAIGLVNSINSTPWLICKKKIDKHRTAFTYDSNSLALNDFKEKRHQLETILNKKIITVENGNKLSIVIITCSNKILPELVNYTNLQTLLHLPSESFFLGLSSDRPKIRQLSKLNHVFISGDRYSGTSTFLNQSLLGLLDSSNNLHIVCADLLGGPEMADFASAPNVSHAESLDKLANMLESLTASATEDSRKTVVALDNIQFLFSIEDRLDKLFNVTETVKAYLLKLAQSKNNNIHLFLVSSTIRKNIVPTELTEHFDSRMEFHTQSSVSITGRGIWYQGKSQTIVQTPFIDGTLIRDRCNSLS